MEVSRSVIPYTQLPVWLIYIATAIMQQKETGMGIGQNGELELRQGKSLSHRTLFWKKSKSVRKDINFKEEL